MHSLSSLSKLIYTYYPLFFFSMPKNRTGEQPTSAAKGKLFSTSTTTQHRDALPEMSPYPSRSQPSPSEQVMQSTSHATTENSAEDKLVQAFLEQRHSARHKSPIRVKHVELVSETSTDNMTPDKAKPVLEKNSSRSELPEIDATSQASLVKPREDSGAMEESWTRSESRVEESKKASSEHPRHSKVRNQKNLSVDTKACRPNVNTGMENIGLIAPEPADAKNLRKDNATLRDLISADGGAAQQTRASSRNKNHVKCSTKWLKCHSIADFSPLSKTVNSGTTGIMRMADPARDGRLKHQAPTLNDSGADVDASSVFTFPENPPTVIHLTPPRPTSSNRRNSTLHFIPKGTPSKPKSKSLCEKHVETDCASKSKPSKLGKLIDRFFSFFPCVNNIFIDCDNVGSRKKSGLQMTHTNLSKKSSETTRHEESEKFRLWKLSNATSIEKRASADATAGISNGRVRKAASISGGNSTSCTEKTRPRNPEMSSRKSSLTSFQSGVDDYGNTIPPISLSLLSKRRASTITWSLPPIATDDCSSTHRSVSAPSSPTTPSRASYYRQPTEGSDGKEEDTSSVASISTQTVLPSRGVCVAPKIDKCQHTLRRFIANEMASREFNYSRNLQTLSESFRIPLAAAAARAAEMEQLRARKPAKKTKSRTTTPPHPVNSPRSSCNETSSTDQHRISLPTTTSEYTFPARTSFTISGIPVPALITPFSPMTDVKDPRCLPDSVKELAETSKALAIELQRVCQNWSNTNSGIGEVLLRHMGERKFDVYLRYCRDYTSVIDAVRRLKKSSFVFKETYATDVNPEKNRFTIASYLILPIQQLGRYPLWLRDLRKATPEDHPDYPGLVLAERQMQDLARVANSWVNEEDLR